jgi:membrane-associated phospholipid phosphatase
MKVSGDGKIISEVVDDDVGSNVDTINYQKEIFPNDSYLENEDENNDENEDENEDDFCDQCQDQDLCSYNQKVEAICECEVVRVDSTYGSELSEDIRKEVLIDCMCNYEYEHKRTQNIMELRKRMALEAGLMGPFLRPISYNSRYTNLFTKGLPHNNEGYVDESAMQTLLTALLERNNNLLASVPLGSERRLLNPSGAWALELMGKNNNSLSYSKMLLLSSPELGEQMCELYCMAWARDVPFASYGDSSIIQTCCQSLNININNIFRGPLLFSGPYISQFLYRDYQGIQQKYQTEPFDYLKTWKLMIANQSGTYNVVNNIKTCRYLITGRDLAHYVHNDVPYHTISTTCAVLASLGVPWRYQGEETPFLNFGEPDLQAILGLVGRSALSSAWYVKWNSLFLRPEAFSIEVDRVFNDGRNRHHISSTLLSNPILKRTKILSQVYPEGAPLSPSTPSGHATYMGACITVLKFFYQTDYQIPIYEPSSEGNSLIRTDQMTTVQEELHKLAFNIGYGRMWAGVNYAMDVISGLKRGQKVALSCLSDFVQRYPEPVTITIHQFNGKPITITNV